MNAQSRVATLKCSGDESLPECYTTSGTASAAHEGEYPRREMVTYDIKNVSQKKSRGIVITLVGFGAQDVFRAYYLNRNGSPRIVQTSTAIRVRIDSLAQAGKQSLSMATLANTAVAARESRPYVWEFALFGDGGSERFCLEMSTRDIVATIRWLVVEDGVDDTFVADSDGAFIYDARTGISATEKIALNFSNRVYSRCRRLSAAELTLIDLRTHSDGCLAKLRRTTEKYKICTPARQ